MFTLFWEEGCVFCSKAISDAESSILDFTLKQVRSVDGDRGFSLIGEGSNAAIVELRGVPAVLISRDGRPPICIIGADCVHVAENIAKAL